MQKELCPEEGRQEHQITIFKDIKHHYMEKGHKLSYSGNDRKYRKKRNNGNCLTGESSAPGKK